jgi:hypothetical protein
MPFFQLETGSPSNQAEKHNKRDDKKGINGGDLHFETLLEITKQPLCRSMSNIEGSTMSSFKMPLAL